MEQLYGKMRVLCVCARMCVTSMLAYCCLGLMKMKLAVWDAVNYKYYWDQDVIFYNSLFLGSVLGL